MISDQASKVSGFIRSGCHLFSLESRNRPPLRPQNIKKLTSDDIRSSFERVWLYTKWMTLIQLGNQKSATATASDHQKTDF